MVHFVQLLCDNLLWTIYTTQSRQAANQTIYSSCRQINDLGKQFGLKNYYSKNKNDCHRQLLEKIHLIPQIKTLVMIPHLNSTKIETVMKKSKQKWASLKAHILKWKTYDPYGVESMFKVKTLIQIKSFEMWMLQRLLRTSSVDHISND